jgi:predicted phosphodiesterase
MTHAFPTPEEVSWDKLDELVGRFFDQPVDIVVTGDNHMERIIEEQGLFLVNPGSPTLPWQMRRLGTVALLDLNRGAPPSARIVDLKTL